MDIGLDKFIEMFEERFGRKATTGLLALIGFGVASAMLHLAWADLVRPLFLVISKINAPNISGLESNPTFLNSINIGLAIGGSVLLLNSILVVFWFMGWLWWTGISDAVENRRRKVWSEKHNAEYFCKLESNSQSQEPQE